MKKIFKIILGTFTWLIIIGYSSPILWAQPAPVPYHQEPYPLYSGTHISHAAKTELIFREVVQVPSAPWLQLHFGEYNFGKHSYITITSLKDGSRQRLNHRRLSKCRKSSVYFNGDAVEVELHVAPGEKNVFYRLTEVTVGEWVGEPESLCGQDDRISFTDRRVGRIMPVACTGWIVSNGAHLTAGHCAGGNNMLWLQFNIPSSLADGTVQHPPAEDQYWIDQTSIVWLDNGIGNDWAVFACDPNLQTNLLDVQAQGYFFRMSRDDSPTTVRVTGYGVDNTPPGSTGNFNSDNQTQQTDSGSFLGEVIEGSSDIYIEYTVDTMGGNSGSPVNLIGSSVTIGIHTNGGCSPPSTGNYGTSFENDALENAIQTFFGANATYVDKDHPVISEDGTVLRPYDKVLEAVAGASSGEIISIVRGPYNEQITISKALTLSAPVGTVTIGE